jgi:hypothetical protein
MRRVPWHRLLGLAGVAGTLVAGAFAADAAGDARVSINGGTLTVSVAPTEPGNHNLRVECRTRARALRAGCFV